MNRLLYLWYLNWTEQNRYSSSHWLSHLQYLKWTEQTFSVFTDFLTCGIWTGWNRYFQFSLTASSVVCESLTLSPAITELDRTDTSSSHWLSPVASEPDRTNTSSSHWLSHLQHLNWTELTELTLPVLTLSPVVAKPDRTDSSQWPSHLRFIGVLVSVPGPLNAGWLGKWAVPRLITFHLTCTGFLCHASFLRRSFSTWWFLSAGSLRSWCWRRLWNMESKKSGF